MLEVNSTNITVQENTPIPLQNVTLIKGCSEKLLGTSTIVFNKCGVYEVNVYADATSAEETTGVVGIQLARNGVLLGVPSMETVASTTASHTLSLTNLVQVPSDNNCKCCSQPTTITVNNIGNTALINIDVVITKVC